MKGEAAKKEDWYYDISSASVGELTPFAASASLLALAWSATGGGSVALIPISLKGKRTSSSPALPVIRAHSGPVS